VAHPGDEEVTLVVREGRILANTEDFAGEAVSRLLRRAGHHGPVRHRHRAGRARSQRRGLGRHRGRGGGNRRTITGDQLLVATGRAPRTDAIGLDTVGLRPGSWLTVDDTCRVDGGGDWLYAAGDLNHRALLTHMGSTRLAPAVTPSSPAPEPSFRVIRCHGPSTRRPPITRPFPRSSSPTRRSQPWSHPPRSGEGGHECRAVDYEIGDVSGAGLIADGYTGHARMVVDEDRSVIVGVTFTGPGVGDLIHAATVRWSARCPSNGSGTPSRHTRR